MSRTRSVALLLPSMLVCAAALFLFTISFRSSRAADLGLGGRVEVKHTEIGYRLATKELRARFHLVSGLAVEYETDGAEQTERVLEMVRLASGPGRLFVVMEGGSVRAVQVTVP